MSIPAILSSDDLLKLLLRFVLTEFRLKAQNNFASSLNLLPVLIYPVDPELAVPFLDSLTLLKNPASRTGVRSRTHQSRAVRQIQTPASGEIGPERCSSPSTKRRAVWTKTAPACSMATSGRRSSSSAPNSGLESAPIPPCRSGEYRSEEKRTSWIRPKRHTVDTNFTI
jgi:hypothetical protein